jgi:hypothetical protein
MGKSVGALSCLFKLIIILFCCLLLSVESSASSAYCFLLAERRGSEANCAFPLLRNTLMPEKQQAFLNDRRRTKDNKADHDTVQ